MMKFLYLSVLALWLTACTAEEVSVRVAEAMAVPGEALCLPVSAAGLEGVTALQFTLAWDSTFLDFQGTEIHGLPGLRAADLKPLPEDPGRLALRWTAADADGLSLDGEITLFSICFQVRGAPGEDSPVMITDDPVALLITGQDGHRMDPAVLHGSIAIRAER